MLSGTERNSHIYRLAKKSNTNFYYSFYSLPEEKRSAIMAIYALCRCLDDIVDESAAGADASGELEKWKTEIADLFDGRPSDPITIALRPHIEKYQIPRKYFLDLIQGIEMDLTIKRYSTFDELHKYCYRVASVVGLICAEVFEYRNATTLGYAVDLGIAMQLTNILRDIKKDAANNRIYIPLEDLSRFGYSEEDLMASTYNERFVEMMRFESERAWGYYKRAEETLPKEDQKSMVAAEIMKAVYSRLLRNIQMNQYDVFSREIRLSKPEKISIAVLAWFKNRFMS